MNCIKLAIFISLLMPLERSYSTETKNFHTVMPENDLRFEVDEKEFGGLTKDEFDHVLNKLDAIYRPYIGQFGLKLKLNRMWQNPTVNASAIRVGNDVVINMFGGMARHPQITIDGFALVACHEFGHHVGGAPLGTDDNGKEGWASAEGQSDYYAAAKCMKKLFFNDNNIEIVKRLSVPSYVAQKCNKAWEDDEYDSALCQRIAMAGQSLANVFSSGRSLPRRPLINTPSRSVVADTITNGYPTVQCRLDTYFAGALCNVDPDEDVSDFDPSVGYCSREYGDKFGVRPSCWYMSPFIDSGDDDGDIDTGDDDLGDDDGGTTIPDPNPFPGPSFPPSNPNPVEFPGSLDLYRVFSSLLYSGSHDLSAHDKLLDLMSTNQIPINTYLREKSLTSTVLQHAVFYEHDIRFIKKLLEMGANPNIRNTQGKTALHHAARKGNLEVLKQLIIHGGDPLIAGSGGVTVFHYAIGSKNLEMIKYLVKYGVNPNISSLESYGTPLHDAVYDGDYATVKLLLDMGVEDSFIMKNNAGYTPYDFAEMRRLPRIMDLLRRYGGSPYKLYSHKIKLNKKYRSVSIEKNGKLYYQFEVRKGEKITGHVYWIKGHGDYGIRVSIYDSNERLIDDGYRRATAKLKPGKYYLKIHNDWNADQRMSFWVH